MAIYRCGGYTGNLVREEIEVPEISSPSKGEPLLLKTLEAIEEYSKTLIVTSNRLTTELHSKAEQAASVASKALEVHQERIDSFKSIAQDQMTQLDQVISNVEHICGNLSYVDQLYNDVCQLSDFLTTLEQIANKPE